MEVSGSVAVQQLQPSALGPGSVLLVYCATSVHSKHSPILENTSVNILVAQRRALATYRSRIIWLEGRMWPASLKGFTEGLNHLFFLDPLFRDSVYPSWPRLGAQRISLWKVIISCCFHYWALVEAALRGFLWKFSGQRSKPPAPFPHVCYSTHRL